MAIPLLIRTAAWAQAMPPLALLLGRNRSRPVLWVAAGALVSSLGNLFGRVAAARLANNHWLAYLDAPLMYSLYLIALSEWQVTPRAERALRMLAFGVLVLYVVIVTLAEDVTTFPRFSAPLYSVALLAAALWTLLHRAFTGESRPLTNTDWFWVTGGLAIYGATTALAEPIGKLLLDASRFDHFILVYSLRAVCIDVAFVAITIGFLLRPGREGPP